MAGLPAQFLPGGVAFLLVQVWDVFVVTGGEEAVAQAGLLRDLNCPLSQGDYFGRPAVPAMIDELLSHQTVVA